MRNKFKGQPESDKKIIQVVANYLLQNWMLKAVFQDLHMEGLVKDFYLSNYCKKNLQLTQIIVSKTMSFQEWEVPTPDHERVPGDEADLFRMDKNLTKSIRQQSQQFFSDMLQLDAAGNSLNSVQQDLHRVREAKSKFPWRIMVLSMEEIKLVI